MGSAKFRCAEDEALISGLSFINAFDRPLINPVVISATAIPRRLVTSFLKIMSQFLIRSPLGNGRHQTIIPQGVEVLFGRVEQKIAAMIIVHSSRLLGVGNELRPMLIIEPIISTAEVKRLMEIP